MPAFVWIVARVRALGARPRALAAGVLLVLGTLGAALFWHSHSAHERWVAQRAQLQEAMDADTTQAYREVVAVGCALLARHPDAPDLGAKVAYAAAILAVEHQDAQMLALARRRIAANDAADGLADAASAELGTMGPEGNAIAARLLMLYGDGDLARGTALAQRVATVHGGRVMAKLEALRLMVASRAQGPDVALLVQSVAADVTDEARALVYLGMWSLAELNTAQAGQYFARALQKSPHHPQALLGAAWVPLFALHATEADRWHAQRQAGEILRLPEACLTPPVQAMALLVRAWVEELEGDGPAAQRDRADALQLAPDHLLHDVAHEGPGRP